MSRDRAPAWSARTILLTTYKRDGTAVPTLVSIAFDAGRVFFRSYDQAGKTKRLRNNPAVKFAVSTLRGKPLGPPVRARAILLEGEQAAIAARALSRRHRLPQGVLVPLAHRLLGYRTMHYELKLESARLPAASSRIRAAPASTSDAGRGRAGDRRAPRPGRSGRRPGPRSTSRSTPRAR